MTNWLELSWQLIRPYGRYLYYQLFPQRRPHYFLDTWKSPRGLLPITPAPPAKPAFLFFPMNDWHARTQRSQHLAQALAQNGHLCIYVNPHLGLEYTLPYWLSPSPRLCILGPNLFELHIHLPREHELNQRLLLPGEVDRIVHAITESLRDTRITRVVSLVSLPVWLDVVEQLRRQQGFPILYDCHDLLAGFPDIPRNVVESEDQLLRTCDWVAFSSLWLMEQALQHKPALRPKAAIVRNGVNPAAFQTTANPPAKPAKKIVGYMGALDHWFDIEAMLTAARQNPALQFELAGAVIDQRILRLKECPNVRFLGEVPYAELPSLLSTWTAATIPFLRNPLTLATNPIKIYEYFSAALPVVCTPLPELELFGDLVYPADTPQQFAAGVAQAVDEDDPSRSARRLAVAREATWAQRARALCSLVDDA